MSTSTVRIVPFLAVSVVLHAAAFIAAGPERLTVSPAAAGIGQVVSIRLQTAPADIGPMHETSVNGVQAHRPGDVPRPLPVETAEPKATRAIAPVEIAETDMTRAATPVEAAVPDTTRAVAPVQIAEPDTLRVIAPVETKELDAPARRQGRQVASADQPRANGAASATSMPSRARAYSMIVTQLAKHFHYPRLARHHGWEGTVVLLVRVLADGRLADIRVKDSSGHALLDRAAVRSLTRIERLPQLAGRTGSVGSLLLEMPVTYRLETV